jgi:membrane protein YdbS with pleckstrin-like domain
MFNNIWLIIVIIIILSIVFLITSFTNEKLTSITIIITISILFIFVINEFNRYNKYNYGDLLKKNCIDENTEYEDPKYHYIFNNSQIYMNQIIQFLILLFYSIILINMNISNKDKLLENNKYIIGLYGFIWTLYLILYFVFYKNESEEHKDSLLITTSVLITVLILIMLFSFIYNNYNIHKKISLSILKIDNNININLAFFYFTSFFILYTIILLTLDTESHKDRINNYIWLINWSKDTDNLREIIKKLTETTGLFFIVSALIFIFIFGYIYI